MSSLSCLRLWSSSKRQSVQPTYYAVASFGFDNQNNPSPVGWSFSSVAVAQMTDKQAPPMRFMLISQGSWISTDTPSTVRFVRDVYSPIREHYLTPTTDRPSVSGRLQVGDLMMCAAAVTKVSSSLGRFLMWWNGLLGFNSKKFRMLSVVCS